MGFFREGQFARARHALSQFCEQDLNALLPRSAATYEAAQLEPRLLAWARDIAREVPAYGAFLAAHGIPVDALRSRHDFEHLPVTTKQNYHQAFELSQLCRGGALDACDMLAVSSGSTGEPTIWPRFVGDELQTAVRFEQVLADQFAATSRSTLAVICFALGSWVGGMYTTACCRHIAAKGYPLTVVTPGNQKQEILRVLRALAGKFEQVVLLGYPPFLKDVIDEGTRQKLDWAALRVRLVMAGEVFSEEWRTLVCARLGGEDPAQITASLYGTADGGVLACETQLSIRIRRAVAARPELARELFGQERLPTLAQYDPRHRYFEQQEGSLLFTGDGATPLVRYKILDQGGIIPYAQLLEFVRHHELDIGAEAVLQSARPLPFVYVFGRSNFAVSFYGANVYPENIAVGLEQPEIAQLVTGKFVLEVTEDQAHNAELRVSVELATQIVASPVDASRVAASIRVHLERVNSEFLHYVPAERRAPKVVLLPLGAPDYFPVGVKHRYTRG
jgi:phenylacetate-CoA ligase